MDEPTPAPRDIQYRRPYRRGAGQIVTHAWVGLTLVGLLVMGWMLLDDMTEPGDTFGPVPVEWLPVAGVAIVVLWWVATIRGAVKHIAVGNSLPSRTEVEGVVVERRSEYVSTGARRMGPKFDNTFWVAIDDGSGIGPIVALRIEAQHWRTLIEGDVVRARIGKRRGWIEDIRVVEPSPARSRILREAREQQEAERLGRWYRPTGFVHDHYRPDRVGPITPDPGAGNTGGPAGSPRSRRDPDR